MAAIERDELEASILDLTHDGHGIADLDGRRVFVPGTLPGEQVLIAPRRKRRRYTEADLVRVIAPSPERVTPPCEVFGRCGGCALQHLSYEAQVRFKQKVVADAFKRIAGIEPDAWLEPIVGPEWRYRRRARLGAKFVEAKERVLVGFRERGAPYITDMSRCPVLAAPLDTLIGPLAETIAASRLKKRLPQIEAAVGDEAAAIVLRVLDTPDGAERQRFAVFGAEHELDVYLQTGGPGTIEPLGTPRPLRYRLADFDVTLEFLPTDFIQINAAVNAQMVAAAVELAELRPDDRVLDLFCGLGNFTLPFARHAGELLGVEGEAGLVARAVHNARLNGIEHARFVAADLAEPDWPFYRQAWDVVLLDPPRTGAEVPVRQLGRAKPRRIVYVSCHPATLARDAKILADAHGYRLRAARVLDMFPHTHHVEAMALFEAPARR